MKTIILKSEDTLDLRLILDLVKRLGIEYIETEQELDLEDLTTSETDASLYENEESEEDSPFTYGENGIQDTSILYESLGLKEGIGIVKYEDLNEKPNLTSLDDYSSKGLFDVLEELGGVWEDDENETLEDLLNMLTP
jgi:hypothetical protein